jgi:glycosyltransferase involved in cell wall biosynthesis
MNAAPPRQGLAALPRKARTAMRLFWFRLRKAGSVRHIVWRHYQTSLAPEWRSGAWHLRLSPWRFVSGLAKAATHNIRPKQVLYAVPETHPEGGRPRILHAIANLHVGGSTQLIFDLCRDLGARYDMRILTGALPANGTHKGVPIQHVPHHAAARQMIRALTDQRPDILHLHYWGEGDTAWYESVLAAGKAAGLTIVQNVNTPVAPIADPAVAFTIFVSHYVQQAFGAGIAPYAVIHPGIELARFEQPEPFDDDALRTIGMVYRLAPDKLRPNAIDVLIDVCKARPEIRAVVVGDGALFDGFVRRTQAAGVRQNFLFTGQIPYDRLPACYRMFRLFVAPVWQESFGQVVPFAMSMGSAVAGNQVGALPEILQSSETLGATQAETTARIVELLDHPDRIVTLGVRNRARANAAFDVHHMTATYGEIYDRLSVAPGGGA